MIAHALPAGREQIEILLELVGDDARGGCVLAAVLRLAVEPGQHGHRQAIVVAMLFGDDRAVAVDGLDAAVHGARQELVGEAAAGEDESRFPAEMEGAAGRAVAMGVSALRAHSGGAGRVGDDSAFGKAFAEDALALGRPAVVAQPAPGLGEAVFQRLGDEASDIGRIGMAVDQRVVIVHGAFLRRLGTEREPKRLL